MPEVRVKTKRGPDKRKRSTAMGDAAVLERKARMFSDRVAGLGYREIAEREGIHYSLAYRQIQEHAATVVPTEDVETVRRIELTRLDKLIARWLPAALGQTKVAVVVKETGEKIEIPIPTDESLKASTHLLSLIDRRWKWSGLEQLTTGAPPVEGMNARDIEDEIKEWAERLVPDGESSS